MAPRLLVLGSVNADLYVEIERLPAPGETIPGHDAAVRPGGKGGNQAGAAARLGAAVDLVAQVGEDVHGPALRRALQEAGVVTDLVATVAGETGQAFMLLQDGGENSIVIVGGANRAWDAPPAEAVAALERAHAVVLQREVPDAVNLGIAQAAAGAGVPVVLDAGGDDHPLPEAILPQLAVLSPNETELARLTGLPTGDDGEVLTAARILLDHGVGSVLVKLGARGSLLVERDREPLHQAIVPVDVVDTTGAGDCFTAAYAVAMAEGRSREDRMRFAATAAALCVTAKGALPSMPGRAAVDQLLG